RRQPRSTLFPYTTLFRSIKEVGIFTPKMFTQQRLHAGDVGYFIANIKTIADMKIGDTITDQRNPAREPLPGFQEIHPMVFSGIRSEEHTSELQSRSELVC